MLGIPSLQPETRRTAESLSTRHALRVADIWIVCRKVLARAADWPRAPS